MDNHNLARNAFIVATICAVLTFLQLMVGTAQWLGWKPPIAFLESPIFRITMLDIILTVVCLGAVALTWYARWRIAPKQEQSVMPAFKLVIHRALYGVPGIVDVDITKSLRTATREGVVIPVDNNLVQSDPYVGRRKRLMVEYSYGVEPFIL